MKTVLGITDQDKLFEINETTDYVGNIIYEKGSLKRILIDGGYIEGGVYYFNLTDHLGNNRVVANASGSIIQRNHYYPFGTPFPETAKDEQAKQPYKYNGKEYQQMHQLNLYDYSARQMDGIRFTSIDPLAEKYYSISPYAYVMNNPLRFIDPTGMAHTSTDPNQWGSLMDHLANGGSLDNFNTNDWEEVEDPKPENSNTYQDPPFGFDPNNNYRSHYLSQNALQQFFESWNIFGSTKKKTTISKKFVTVVLIPSAGTGRAAAFIPRSIFLILNAYTSKSQEAVTLHVSGMTYTCLDVGTDFNGTVVVEVFADGKSIGTQLLENGRYNRLGNEITFDGIDFVMPIPKTNSIDIKINGNFIYYASPLQPVSTDMSRKLNINY